MGMIATNDRMNKLNPSAYWGHRHCKYEIKDLILICLQQDILCHKCTSDFSV